MFLQSNPPADTETNILELCRQCQIDLTYNLIHIQVRFTMPLFERTFLLCLTCPQQFPAIYLLTHTNYSWQQTPKNTSDQTWSGIKDSLHKLTNCASAWNEIHTVIIGRYNVQGLCSLLLEIQWSSLLQDFKCFRYVMVALIRESFQIFRALYPPICAGISVHYATRLLRSVF